MIDPRSGSGSLRFGTGGTTWCSRIFTPITSSTPTPIGWPVNPFVFATMTRSAPAPNTFRSAAISAAALPPRAGVYVSCETNTVLGAIAVRFTPKRLSAERTRFSTTSATCATSSRVAW